MIVTVTLNPSLDRTLSVPVLQPGTLHRARLVRVDLGGKGINVSRALKVLDLPSRIVAFAGGRTGKALRDGLLAEGFEVSFIEVMDEIRQNITLLDETTGEYTKINEEGPAIAQEQIAALEELIEQTVKPGDLWSFCGSLPPGTPVDLYARLIAQVQKKKALAFLDASGIFLREGMNSVPFAVKVNCEEAGELLGYQIEDEHAALEAAHDLQNRGIHLVILTRGKLGLILAMDGQMVIANPPAVTALSPIGAGDATLAGLLWAVTDQSDAFTSARRAVACGTAAAMQAGTGIGNLKLILHLQSRTEIRVI